MQGVHSEREGVVSNLEMKKVSTSPRNSPHRVDVPICTWEYMKESTLPLRDDNSKVLDSAITFAYTEDERGQDNHA